MHALPVLGALLLSGGLLAQAPPDGAEQDRLLESIEAYAAGYVSGLPNFLCEQVTHQYEAALNSNRWRQGDSLTSRLTFQGGEEKRVLELVNGKPADPERRQWRTPLTTEGEFGTLLGTVAGPGGEATFTWNRWETLRGKRLAVFDFSVDKERSTLRMRLSDMAQAVLPYHGSLFADPVTGAVWRITNATTSDIPPKLEMRDISTVIDYDETTIGDKQYLLPVSATVSVTTWSRRIRNEIQFQGYRKFEADSVIHFEPGTANQH
jgi:hypothetical protein